MPSKRSINALIPCSDASPDPIASLRALKRTWRTAMGNMLRLCTAAILALAGTVTAQAQSWHDQPQGGTAGIEREYYPDGPVREERYGERGYGRDRYGDRDGWRGRDRRDDQYGNWNGDRYRDRDRYNDQNQPSYGIQRPARFCDSNGCFASKEDAKNFVKSQRKDAKETYKEQIRYQAQQQMLQVRQRAVEEANKKAVAEARAKERTRAKDKGR
jgi:hypothetical protein